MSITVENPFLGISPFYRSRDDVFRSGTCDECGGAVKAMIFLSLAENLDPQEAKASYLVNPGHVDKNTSCRTPRANLVIHTTKA